MAHSIYRRLTGKRRRLHLFTQLFLGPDHLMLVRSSRFEERYQRFYFKDIQALILTGLPNRTWLQASLGVLAGSIFLLALTVVPNPALRGLLGLVGVIPAAIALADYLRGPRCRMIVKTPVSNESLPPVSRLAVARLVISRLKPAVEQVQQGEWISEMTPASGPPALVPPPLTPAPADRLLPAVFGLVSLDAIIYVAARLTQRNEVLILLFYTVFTEIALAITALRRRGADPRWILFSLSGVVAVCATLDIVGGLGLFGLFISVANDDRAAGTSNTAKFLTLAYPQAFMWWGFGWRAAIAIFAWASYLLKIEPPKSLGGPESIQ